MSNEDILFKNHLNSSYDKLLNIISSALAYHLSMDGSQNDDMTGEKIYSNIFKTIDMLFTAWFMIEKNKYTLEPLLYGLDLELEQLNIYDNLDAIKNIKITTNDNKLNCNKKYINKLPDELKIGLDSKFLLIPFNLKCDSEKFMTRYQLEKNTDFIINKEELNKNLDIEYDNFSLNNINVNFHPAQHKTYSLLFNDFNNNKENSLISEGLYYRLEELYFINKKFKNYYEKPKNYNIIIKHNENVLENNFNNINVSVINKEKETTKRKKVYQELMYKFGYQNEYKELDFNKLNFDNYPNLVNYLSLIISYYGIYEIDKNINHLKGTVDIIENNLLGNLHFNIKDCNYLYDIKLKKK